LLETGGNQQSRDGIGQIARQRPELGPGLGIQLVRRDIRGNINP
jgi:hypothetical protein